LALFRINQRLLEYQQQLRKPCPPANSSVALPCSGILLGRFSESDGLEQLSINLDQANAVLDALRYAVSANFQAPETVKGLFTTEDCMDRYLLLQYLHFPHPCGSCRRYDPTDGGGRAMHGAIAESTNSRRFKRRRERLPRTRRKSIVNSVSAVVNLLNRIRSQSPELGNEQRSETRPSRF